MVMTVLLRTSSYQRPLYCDKDAESLPNFGPKFHYLQPQPGLLGSGYLRQLGVTSFHVSSRGDLLVKSNGLPCALATCEVVARFEDLKTILHPNLCEQVELLIGRFGQVSIVSEYYPTTLGEALRLDCLSKNKPSLESLAKLTYQLVAAVTALTSSASSLKTPLKAICNIDPTRIQFATNSTHSTFPTDWETLISQSTVKLSGFGLGHLTRYGQHINFPISNIKYTAPEAILNQDWWTTTSPENQVGESSPFSDTLETSLPFDARVDTWSIGLVIAEIITGKNLFLEYVQETNSLSNKKLPEKMFLAAASLATCSKEAARFKDYVSERLRVISDYQLLVHFIELALQPTAAERRFPQELAGHGFISSVFLARDAARDALPLFSTQVQHQTLSNLRVKQPCFYSELSLREIFHLWQLSGGSLENGSPAPVESLPVAVFRRDSVWMEVGGQHPSSLPFENQTTLVPTTDLKSLIGLAKLSLKQYPPLDLSFKTLTFPNQPALVFKPLNITESLDAIALNEREVDFEYQLRRIRMFRRLLLQYPASKDEIGFHSKWDIPPLLRGSIWATLLGVTGNYQARYDVACSSRSKLNTQSDRQIEVDVPRCHQYHPLLASQLGQQRLANILKAWAAKNEGHVYWQGLDSLCAPFLVLNFNDEALAFACLQQLITRVLSQLFIPDNTFALQNRLHAFNHLMSFHDPQLALYAHSLGFYPQLYAISWFLTLFTHVFSLDKIFLLWDRFLAGPPSLPLFTAVAIMHLLRTTLLASDFNQCILFFSESFPDLDIQLCLATAFSFYEATPTSVLSTLAAGSDLAADSSSPTIWKLSADLDQVPLISGEDFYSWRNHLLVVDVRSYEDYSSCHHHKSIYMKFPIEKKLHLREALEQIARQIRDWKLLVVVGDNDESAQSYATALMQLFLPRVTILPSDINHLVLSQPMSGSSPSGIICDCEPSRFMIPRLELGSPSLSIFKCQKFRNLVGSIKSTNQASSSKLPPNQISRRLTFSNS